MATSTAANRCDSCEKDRKTRVVTVSDFPMVMSLCDECRAAGAIPYDVLVTAVWLNAIGVTDSRALDIALYHGKSAAEFEFDSLNFADKMREAFDE